MTASRPKQGFFLSGWKNKSHRDMQGYCTFWKKTKANLTKTRIIASF